MSVARIIEDLKSENRVGENPSIEDREIDAFETKHKVVFPGPFREAARSGSYDIANFYYRPPWVHERFPEFAAFAEWNEDLFAFALSDIGAAGSDKPTPVFVLVEGFEPEKRYQDFEEWFGHVVSMAKRPQNPE